MLKPLSDPSYPSHPCYHFCPYPKPPLCRPPDCKTCPQCATQQCKVACLWSDNSPSCHACVDEECTPTGVSLSPAPMAMPAALL